MNEWKEHAIVYLIYFPLHYAWPALHPLVNYTASQLLYEYKISVKTQSFVI